MQAASPQRTYKYYDLVAASFVAVLLCSNLIGPGKVCTLFGFTFGAGVLFFPISYLFGDLLTEVYGYARTRRVVWSGFAALAFASLMSYVVVALPPAAGWGDQAAYQLVLGQTPRVMLASLVAFWAGEFVNSYVLARLKIKTAGRFLWARTISSTVVGQAVDSLIFYPVAFYGLWPNELVWQVMLSNYLLKVVWEAVATPLTYQAAAFLKRAEREDHFDVGTRFTPFSLET